MGTQTGIQWTNKTWNPWRGCTKVSPGCAHCYMFTEQKRYGHDPSIVVKTKTWNDPLRWQKEAESKGTKDLVFTCSWSDWFHEDADQWRPEAWAIVRACPNLIFQILTKRPERIHDHLPLDWRDGYPNVWLGVSVENRLHGLPRIDTLRYEQARIRFLSIEPLLEPLGPLNLTGIHWGIIGGESGPGARQCSLDWIEGVAAQFRYQDVPVFVKQLGSKPVDWNPSLGEYELYPVRDHKGGNIAEFPVSLKIRQFPR